MHLFMGWGGGGFKSAEGDVRGRGIQWRWNYSTRSFIDSSATTSQCLETLSFILPIKYICLLVVCNSNQQNQIEVDRRI